MRKHTISFKNAFHGIWVALTTQANLRIHLIFAIIVSGLGLFFEINSSEWITLILTYSVVIIAEMVNTAIEFVCNAITRDFSEDIGHAKDISAGAVLIAAMFSVIIGLIIFLPKLQSYLLGKI